MIAMEARRISSSYLIMALVLPRETNPYSVMMKRLPLRIISAQLSETGWWSIWAINGEPGLEIFEVLSLYALSFLLSSFTVSFPLPSLQLTLLLSLLALPWLLEEDDPLVLPLPRPHSPLCSANSMCERNNGSDIETYAEFVSDVDKGKMVKLEEEVRQLREFHDDEEVEAQIGNLIPNLGCSLSLLQFKIFPDP
jgi:hypothetical protein